MVPFVNRIPGNVLSAAGHAYTVTPNFNEPWALHGCGWQMPWTVVSRDANSVVLELSVSASDFAFPFRVRQNLVLDDAALTTTIEVANTGGAAIPVGFGLHPYFPVTDNTTLQFSAERFWLEGPGYLPTDPVSIPPELSFAAAQKAPSAWRNNCYAGWDGRATIGQPDFGFDLEIEAGSNFTDLVLFTAGDGQTFALEPQTNTIGAVSSERVRPHQSPMLELLTGQTVAGTCRFAVAAHDGVVL